MYCEHFKILFAAKQPCLAFDVAINSTFFLKVEESLLFQTFLITLVCEGLEDKYNTELDKNSTFFSLI